MSDVNELKTANADLGVVYEDIDSAVEGIQFENILNESDRAVEAFK